MGHERWFRGQHDGQGRPFDWLTAARQQGIPWQRAQELYEQAVHQADGATPGRVQELYLGLLEGARRDAARPSPGKVTRTMRLEAERASRHGRPVPQVSRLTGRPIAPGKRPLTWYLEPTRRASHTRDHAPLDTHIASLPAETATVPADPRDAPAGTRGMEDQERPGHARALRSGATWLPEQEISAPGTAAHRRLDAHLAAAVGYFEELDALEAEHSDTATIERDAHLVDAPAARLLDGISLRQALRHTFGEAAATIPVIESSAVPRHALAATVDRGVHLAPGQADFGDRQGRVILGHEIAHALQQGRSDTARTLSPDRRASLEAEADHAGLAFARGERFAVHGRAPASIPLFFHQPIVTRAPPTAITIRDFIRLVEAEERRWPPAEQTQTALMISRLRKIFYGTSGWDKYLIPGAAGVSSGYNVGEAETGRENLSLFGFDADIVRSRQVTTDAAGRAPAIASQQEVQLEDGSFCDIGHVFAGLDAANHPTSVSAPLGIASVTSNLGAVTWTGDLGSVLAEVAFKRQNLGRLVTDAEVQAIVDEYASPQDMLGNIDAYVMSGQYDITNGSGKKVSELLRAYYLGTAGSADGEAREHRYSRFCAMTGLTGWNGTSFTNEADWVNRWTPDVGGAAALYVGASTAGVLSIPGRGGAISGIQNNPLAHMLVQRYLDALKVLVAAEPPP